MSGEFDIACFEAVQGLSQKNEEYRTLVAAIRQKWLAIDRRVEQTCAPLLEKVWANLSGAEATFFKPVSDTSVLPPFFGRIELPSDADCASITQVGGIDDQVRGGTNAVASMIASMIERSGAASERDDELLQHLQRVSSRTLDPPAVGFEVMFTFSSAARAYVLDETASADEPLTLRIVCECDPVDLGVLRIVSTCPRWKKGCNPTVMQVDTAQFLSDDDEASSKRPRSDGKKKGKGQPKKSTVQTIPCPSFFNIFQNYDLSKMKSQAKHDDDDDDDEDSAQRHGEKIALAEALESFHSFSALTPVHSFWMPSSDGDDENDGFGCDFGDEDDDAQSHEDEDEDDDGEDEEEQEAPARKKTKAETKQTAPAAPPPGKKPECKQQ
jgi:hypothetical protein